MKFDVVITNPPYQSLKEGRSNSTAIWQHFIFKAQELVKEDGYLIAIHPAGWRNVTGNFKKVQNLLKLKNMLYLEMHSVKDGLKTFGATTTYDWYIVQNCEYSNKTNLVCYDGEEVEKDISIMDFIPNGSFNEIEKLIAKDGKEQACVMFDTIYHVHKHLTNGTMSIKQDEEYCYPVIKYMPLTKAIPDLRWASINKGHFGIPKVIFGIGAGAGKITIDYDGNYGMGAWVAGIKGDSKEELENIHKALNSKEFSVIMRACRFNRGSYNHKVIALFRKDFWKEFI